MAYKRKFRTYARRDFLKQVAAGGALASTPATPTSTDQANKSGTGGAGGGAAAKSSSRLLPPIEYPRTFAGRNLKMIVFPLGGIGTGYLSPAQPRPSVSLWPTLVPRDQVQMKLTLVEAGARSGRS